MARGPKKEKCQISVRVAMEVMDAAYEHMRRTGCRITDLIERGMILAIEQDLQLPHAAQQVRFLLPNATIDGQRRVTALLATLAAADIHGLSPAAREWRNTTVHNLDVAKEVLDGEKEQLFKAALESYKKKDPGRARKPQSKRGKLA